MDCQGELQSNQVLLTRFLTSCTYRLITVVQAGGFAVITLGRLASRLPITTLELTTLAFLFITLVFSLFWRHKPQDVATSIILEASLTQNQLHQLVGIPQSRVRASPDLTIARSPRQALFL